MNEEEKQSSLANSMRKKIADPLAETFEPANETNMALIRERAKNIAATVSKDLRKEMTDEIYDSINQNIKLMVENVNAPLSTADKNILLERVRDEVFGFGPLGPHLRDPTVENIYVNHCKKIYVRRLGKIFETDSEFNDEKHLLETIDKIFLPLGIKIDASNPMATGRLPNGARVEAAVPPVSSDGASLTIDCITFQIVTLSQLAETGTLSNRMGCLLRAYAKQGSNMMISGSSESGKKSLICALSFFVSKEERVISVESVAEMRLLKSNLLRLELANEKDTGITFSDLIEKAFDMHPDRIFVGEFKECAAYSLVSKLSLGGVSSITSFQASSPEDCLNRLAVAVKSCKPEINDNHLMDMISRSIQVIVQTKYFGNDGWKVTSIAEVLPSYDRFEIATIFELDEEKAKNGQFEWQEHEIELKHVKEVDYDSELL